jgi:hypothetical protein
MFRPELQIGKPEIKVVFYGHRYIAISTTREMIEKPASDISGSSYVKGLSELVDHVDARCPRGNHFDP